MTKLLYWISAAVLISGVVAIAAGVRDEGAMPDLNGAVAWLNSVPLSNKSLRGKWCWLTSGLTRALTACESCRT
jgi:hypothetical protein